MLLRAKKEVQLTISFEQCSYVILEKAYSISSRPKMIVVSHYVHPKNILKKMIKRGFFL